MLKRYVALVLSFAIVSSPLRAQTQSDADTWRTFAHGLAPNAYVHIHLKNGRTVKGRVVGSGDAALSVSPKTRIAVPIQEVSYGEIASIEKKKPPKMPPGAKVLLGVAIGFGTLMMFTAIALAGAYD